MDEWSSKDDGIPPGRAAGPPEGDALARRVQALAAMGGSALPVRILHDEVSGVLLRAMASNAVATIADLGVSDARFMGWGDCGPGRLLEACRALDALADALGRIEGASRLPPTEIVRRLLRRRTLVEYVGDYLARQSPEGREVLVSAVFADGDRASMAGVARRFESATRYENPVERGKWSGLNRLGSLREFLDDQIGRQLGDRGSVSVKALERADPWFAGVAARPGLLRGTLDALRCDHILAPGAAGGGALVRRRESGDDNPTAFPGGEEIQVMAASPPLSSRGARRLPLRMLDGFGSARRSGLGVATIGDLAVGMDPDFPFDWSMKAPCPWWLGRGWGPVKLARLHRALDGLRRRLSEIPGVDDLRPAKIIEGLARRRGLVERFDAALAALPPAARRDLEETAFADGSGALHEALGRWAGRRSPARAGRIAGGRTLTVEEREIVRAFIDSRLSRGVGARRGGLPLPTLERRDAWFAGVAARPGILRGALDTLRCAFRVSLDGDGEPVVTRRARGLSPP